MSREMRQAVRDKRKTMCRVLVRRQPSRFDPEPELLKETQRAWPPQRDGKGFPFGKVGDIFYLREPLKKFTHYVIVKNKEQNQLISCYADDGEKEVKVRLNGEFLTWKWGSNKLSHAVMPKFAARTFVKLVNKKAEWLQELNEEDAKKEGLESCHPSDACSFVYRDYFQGNRDAFEWFSSPVESYKTCWNKIYEKRNHGWEKNELVWVLEWEFL